MTVQPFTPPGVLTANALAGQTVPGALGVTGALTAGPLSAPLLEQQAATVVGGVALINGTQNFATWTTPNDGKLHRVQVFASLLVTSTETGGLVQVAWTGPGGAVQSFTQAFAAALAAATNAYTLGGLGLLVAANTAVTVQQSSALTVGASTCWAEIWGS